MIRKGAGVGLWAASCLAAALPCLAAAQRPLGQQDVDKAVRAAYDRYKGLQDGKLADDVPALAQQPPELFAIAVMTTGGLASAVGDKGREFSLQSISSVLTLARVLEDSGPEEPSGGAAGPLGDPGALAATSRVKGATPEAQWSALIAMDSAFAGRSLKLDQKVYKSASEAGERDRAIAMLLHAGGVIAKDRDPLKAADLYARQCSVAVDTEDLARMAATLANGGKDPKTGKQVISADHATQVLALMATAGLRDGTGRWLALTGLPAKGGSGGGLLAVSPGRFGIAAFSPRLDAAGNSVRAQKAIADISDALGGNPYAVGAGETQKDQPGR